MDFQSFWKSKIDRFWEGKTTEASGGSNSHFPWALKELRPKNYVNRCKSAALYLGVGRYLGPFDKSPGTGLAIWDRVLTVCRKDSVVLTAGSASSKYTNTDWASIQSCMNNVGVKDGKLIRPSGDYVWDITSMKKSWDIIRAAHILTHKYLGKVDDYSASASMLDLFIFKICLAMRYDLVIDTEPKNAKDEDTLDSLDKRGIRLLVTPNFRKPKLDFPCTGPQALVPDRDTMVVVGSVHTEPQPNPGNVDKGKWMESNRWSCLPTIASFVGWQTVDEISSAPLVQYKKHGNLYFEIPVVGLEPPSVFPYLFPEADKGDGKRYFKVNDWLKSKKFQIDLKNSLTLPCKSCMRVARGIEGCPVRPTVDPDDSKPWKEYKAGMDAIYDVCKKATVYYEGKLKGHKAVKKERRESEANAAKMAAMERRIQKLKQQALRHHTNGFISKSVSLRIEAKQLEDVLAGMRSYDD